MRDPETTTLPGGERLISERVPGTRSVALGLWIATGSRDEPRSRAGVSHFIEHLLFKGSSRYGAQEIAELFDAMGGELNAATSRETTVLYTRVPDRRLEQALDAMADMVFAPLFDDVDSEREVVLEEIAMVDDNPQDLVHDIAAEAVFGAHPLGPTRDRQRRGHRQRLAESAPVMARRRLRRLEHRPRRGREPASRARSSSCSRGDAPRERAPLASTAGRSAGCRSRATASSAAGTEQYHVVLAAPGIARDDDRRYAASILDAILGGSASSRLFQEIREKRGMAYSVYTYGSQYAETGQVGIYVGTREDNLRECLDVTAAELADVSAGNLRPGELERAKENLEGRLLLSLESTSNRMTRLGRALVTDTELVPTEETIRRIRARDGGRRRRRLERALRAGAALGGGHRAAREPVPLRRGAGEPGARRAVVKICLFGAAGKVGSVLGPALERAGHEVVDGRVAGPTGATSRSTSPGRTPWRAMSSGASKRACRS